MYGIVEYLFSDLFWEVKSFKIEKNQSIQYMITKKKKEKEKTPYLNIQFKFIFLFYFLNTQLLNSLQQNSL